MSEARLPRRTFLERGSLLAAGLSLGKSAMAQSGSSTTGSGSSNVKVGINLLLWTATPTVEHFSLLDDLKKWGYDGAEFPMFDPTVGDWAKLGKHCDELGLDRTSQTIVSEAANPVSPDPKVRQAAVEHLKLCVDRTVEVGAKTIAGPLYGPVGTLVGRGRTEEEFKRCVGVMRKASEYAATAGIGFSHEPLNRFETYLFNSQQDGLKLVDAVGMPNFGLHYDTFHAHIEQKDVLGTIREAGKRIHHVHISENDRSTPGAGQVRWQETFQGLKEIGYDRWLTLEAFGRAMPEVAAATCIWRSMFESEEQLARDGLRFVRESWAAA